MPMLARCWAGAFRLPRRHDQPDPYDRHRRLRVAMRGLAGPPWRPIRPTTVAARDGGQRRNVLREMTMDKTFLWSVQDGIGRLTFNRPDQANSIGLDGGDDMTEAIERVAASDARV